MLHFSQKLINQIKQRIGSGAEKLDIPVDDAQIDLLIQHADQLLIWNRKTNLTAIKDPLAVAEKHIIDSIAAAGLFHGDQAIMDLGSGGGFPGIPLKIMVPSLNLLLLDASAKKVSFLKQVIRLLHLDTIDAVHGRAEDLQTDSRYAGQFDAVICRAFSDLTVFTRLALPFINSSGCLVAMKGSAVQSEVTAQLNADFDIHITAYELPFEKAGRSLLTARPKRG